MTETVCRLSQSTARRLAFCNAAVSFAAAATAGSYSSVNRLRTVAVGTPLASACGGARPTFFLVPRRRVPPHAVRRGTAASAVNNLTGDDPGKGRYRPFVERALNSWTDWTAGRTCESAVGRSFSEDLPGDLLSRSCPSAGKDNDSDIRLEAGAVSPAVSGIYGRYALIETLGGDPTGSPTGIQVLNFVLLPSPETDAPAFGADLVSLPGDRHLAAIDFQPLRGNGGLGLTTEELDRLRVLRAKYQPTEELPWGGDIPEAASRFFSEEAIWTRLGAGGGDVAGTVLYEAFGDYLDLYLDVLGRALDDSPQTVAVDDSEPQDPGIVEGRAGAIGDYLAYRSANDPARPMLQRLYGEEFAERLIAEVLFPANVFAAPDHA